MLRRIWTLAPLLKPRALRFQEQKKQADERYLSSEHRAWREAVVSRAGRRCEAVEDGRRCHKAEPEYRMFADHIVELSDGGAQFDTGNGRCLCGRHHTLKTVQARATRAFALPSSKP